MEDSVCNILMVHLDILHTLSPQDTLRYMAYTVSLGYTQIYGIQSPQGTLRYITYTVSSGYTQIYGIHCLLRIYSDIWHTLSP